VVTADGPPRPALTLDALGRRCPQPVIMLARRIGEVAPGEVVGVLADDAAARLDVPAWCEMRGQTYLGEADPEGGTQAGGEGRAGATDAPAPGRLYLVRRET
jgi:TusA-related sulfurtransferase